VRRLHRGEAPAQPRSIRHGEVEEVKREKDIFFNALAVRARDQANEAGIELVIELRAGHAAEVISDFATAGHSISSCSAIAAISCATTSLARPRTESPSTFPCPVMIVR
jgi:hypothetical protein